MSSVQGSSLTNFPVVRTKIEELSILFLGVDSVSRSNMIRYMPETRKYLLQNMSAFELIGRTHMNSSVTDILDTTCALSFINV
jgi:hypothetical protein